VDRDAEGYHEGNDTDTYEWEQELERWTCSFLLLSFAYGARQILLAGLLGLLGPL